MSVPTLLGVCATLVEIKEANLTRLRVDHTIIIIRFKCLGRHDEKNEAVGD